jgi:hypothetical protein
MCHSLFQLGFYKFPYVPKASSSTSSQREIDDLRPLESLLGYIYHVRITGNTISGRGETSNASTGINKIRSRLLFYKNFVAHSRTVVVCEGKTDPIYLKCALSRLDNYRNAFQMNPFGTGDVGLNFLKFTKPVSDLLDLGGGVESLKVFIKQYSKNVLSYKHRPLIRPTIILIDNDQGAVGIFSLVKKLFGVNISHQADDHFYYLINNLYLIKTPELGDNGMSCIEDLFEQKVLGVKLGDATFSLNKKHAADDEYGRNVLAESVVKPNKNNISFINFSVLFDRIGAVEEDYITRLSSVST